MACTKSLQLKIMTKVITILCFVLLLGAPMRAQQNDVALNIASNNQLEIISAPEEPNYTRMAQRDAKKFFSTKKQFWTGLVCGFTPVVGWVTAPILGATVKLKDKQMWNPGNINNHFIEENTTYANAYKRYCIKKRAKGFVVGFTVGIGILAGYYIATQPEYKK